MRQEALRRIGNGYVEVISGDTSDVREMMRKLVRYYPQDIKGSSAFRNEKANANEGKFFQWLQAAS